MHSANNARDARRRSAVGLGEGWGLLRRVEGRMGVALQAWRGDGEVKGVVHAKPWRQCRGHARQAGARTYRNIDHTEPRRPRRPSSPPPAAPNTLHSPLHPSRPARCRTLGAAPADPLHHPLPPLTPSTVLHTRHDPPAAGLSRTRPFPAGLSRPMPTRSDPAGFGTVQRTMWEMRMIRVVMAT